MPFSLKMSKNIKFTTRHLTFSYISILTNLLQIDKRVKTIYNLYRLKKIKRTKCRRTKDPIKHLRWRFL